VVPSFRCGLLVRAFLEKTCTTRTRFTGPVSGMRPILRARPVLALKYALSRKPAYRPRSATGPAGCCHPRSTSEHRVPKPRLAEVLTTSALAGRSRKTAHLCASLRQAGTIRQQQRNLRIACFKSASLCQTTALPPAKPQGLTVYRVHGAADRHDAPAKCSGSSKSGGMPRIAAGWLGAALGNQPSAVKNLDFGACLSNHIYDTIVYD